MEKFAEDFLKKIVGIKNPDYATKMLFITRYLMPSHRCRRRRTRRSFRKLR